MVYEADTLRDLLFNNWSLTGNLSKEGTANILRPVFFFARRQVDSKIEKKAVEVVKNTPLDSKRSTEFFDREESTYEITVRYILSDTDRTGFDDTESNVEDMEQEVERILTTIFADPQSGINVWFTSDRVWRNNDDINRQKQKPMIERILVFTLTKITSRSTKVFDSFQRGVLFDLSESSNLGTPPAGDYQYPEVFNVTAREGHRIKELQVTSHPDGDGNPIPFGGAFSGVAVMESYIHADDIGSTTDKINQIKKRQTNGELPEVALLQTYTNNNSQTLNWTTIMQVVEINLIAPMSDLIRYQILAKIIKPSTLVIT